MKQILIASMSIAFPFLPVDQSDEVGREVSYLLLELDLCVISDGKAYVDDLTFL
jgi:hypothetical protein